jgi:hypothetical protein
MRSLALVLTVLATGCEARSSAETLVAFVLIFGTLSRLFIVEPQG